MSSDLIFTTKIAYLNYFSFHTLPVDDGPSTQPLKNEQKTNHEKAVAENVEFGSLDQLSSDTMDDSLEAAGIDVGVIKEIMEYVDA